MAKSKQEMAGRSTLDHQGYKHLQNPHHLYVGTYDTYNVQSYQQAEERVFLLKHTQLYI